MIAFVSHFRKHRGKSHVTVGVFGADDLLKTQVGNHLEIVSLRKENSGIRWNNYHQLSQERQVQQLFGNKKGQPRLNLFHAYINMNNS